MVRSLLFSFVVLVAPTVSAKQSLVDHFVLLESISQKPMVNTPWKFESIKQDVHLGTFLGDGKILVAAYAVADAQFLQIRRFGASVKHEAEVIFVDYEVNLALIRAKEPDVLQGMQPIEFAKRLPVGVDVTLLTDDKGYQLTENKGQIIDVGSYQTPLSMYSMIQYRVKLQRSALGWSEPILYEGKMVGMTTGQDTGYIYATPGFIIEHFLNDSHDEKYRGFPAIGVETYTLLSKPFRKYLQADSVNHGVRVAKIHKTSGFFGQLEVDDVMLEIEGYPISDTGLVNDSVWGSLPLKFVLNQKYDGDEIGLKILRKGKEMELKGTLHRFRTDKFRIPYRKYNSVIDHVIFGGVVFQKLTRDFLKGWGENWIQSAPTPLLFHWFYNNEPVSDDESVIVVSKILEHPHNAGYGDLEYRDVLSVNGQDVKTLDDVKTALQQPVGIKGRNFAVIQLGGTRAEILLGYQGIADVHKALDENYQIGPAGNFFEVPAELVQ